MGEVELRKKSVKLREAGQRLVTFAGLVEMVQTATFSKDSVQ